MSIFLMILGIVLFVLLVVVHEWGHFIAARRGGVEVEEFGIGFPPKIWAKKIKSKKSKFLFTINALPLGGFVRLKGENDSDTRPGSFGAAPLNTKVRIMLAGVVMNLLVAFIAFTFLAAVGIPKLFDDQFTVASDTKIIKEVENKGQVLVSSVIENSPAAKAGLAEDDILIKINGQQVEKASGVADITKQNAGQTIPVEIVRNGQSLIVTVTLNSENNGQGYLGVASTSGEKGIELRRSTWSAPIVGVGLIGQLGQQTYAGLGSAVGNLFKGDTTKASEQVTGPVGIVVILKEGSKYGINFVLMFIAVISLALALINILPIPALDGGRLFVTLLFRALNKPLTKSKEEKIHGTGFAVLMILFVLITIVDVRRFF